MRAGLFRSVWIMLQTGWFTGLTCLRVIYHEKNRTKVDALGRRWAKAILKTVKLQYQVHHPERLQKAPDKCYIVMANHASHYDIPLCAAVVPYPLRFLAKKELSRIPLFGQALRAAGHVFVDRDNRRQAVKDLKLARERLQKGEALWIAPEGTRSRTGKLGPLKQGGFIIAIKAKAQIIPISIKGNYDVLPPKTLRFQLNQSVDLYVGEPIDAGAYTLADKASLIERVESEMRQHVA